MTEFLDANTIGWTKRDTFRTINRVTPSIEDRDLTMGGVVVVPLKLENLSLMPVNGKVVGLIVHCDVNTHPDDQEVVFLKGVGVPASFTLTEMKVKAIVKGGTTGFFFSDPTIAEFDREFSIGDFIGVRVKKPTGANGTGMDLVTIMAAVEMQFTT